MFELYTHDIVAATSSKGNQEKWYDAPSDRWYKLDTGAFEALSETIASFILAHSNLSDLGFSAVPYQIEKVRVHKREQIACVSSNFCTRARKSSPLLTYSKPNLAQTISVSFTAGHLSHCAYRHWRNK